MPRFLAPLCAAAALFLSPMVGSALASTITYDVTFTPGSGGGSEGGSGYFTIDTPTVGSSGNATITAESFTFKTLTVNGSPVTPVFTLNSSSEVGYYYSGNTLVLDNIGYTGSFDGSILQLTGVSLGGYYFGDNANGGYVNDTNGSVAIALAATPLPAALPLFAGGLGFVGFLAKRRKRNAPQALVAA
jgi:hypothetical protein